MKMSAAMTCRQCHCMIMTYDKFRREDGVLQFPDQAVQEYSIKDMLFQKI